MWQQNKLFVTPVGLKQIVRGIPITPSRFTTHSLNKAMQINLCVY